MKPPTRPPDEAKPTARTNGQAAAKAGNGAAPDTAPLGAGALDAFADIARRAHRMAHQQVERLKTDDGYQVIDSSTVNDTFHKFVATAQFDRDGTIKDQFKLWTDMMGLWQQTTARFLSGAPAQPVIKPDPQDKRFKNELWSDNCYFDYLKQSYLLMARHVQKSVDGATGVDPHIHRKMRFYTRQFVNALSPANFVATNPVAIKTALDSGGESLVKGLRNLIEDIERGNGRLSLKMSDLTAFKFGENIASSPGKVVHQNELMQLIQYAPTTPTVHRRPLLIVPPWINKFYILDLKPKNSFIKWCTDQGHTVFVVSWVNPGGELADKGFADYLLEGPLQALGAIERATGEDEVNVIGYCIGGTLTASTLAYMAATNDRRIASATFFTTLLDFTDVGDILVFIDEGQLTLADEHMDRIGYFEGHHMSEAFNLLRENDLIWFFVNNNYLLGRDPAAFDLLYWNADSTRMPAAMQSFYLRKMYLENVLRHPGGINLVNTPIDLSKIEVPVYFLSTREDHIAPWRATYAGAHLVSGPVRFVLGASGHVAGVINPPSANKYGYWTNDSLPEDPGAWLDHAEYHAGSWWTDWGRWVGRHGGALVAARQPEGGIDDAPGSYVKVRAA